MQKYESEVSELLVQQHICLELLLIGNEMQLAQIFDDEYCNNLIDDLNMHFIMSVDFNRRIINKYSGVLELIEQKAIFGKAKIQDQRKEFDKNFIKRVEDFEKNVENTIDTIKNFILFTKEDQEFIVNNNINSL